MPDDKTLAIVRSMLFRLLPDGPNASQEAAAVRIASAYEAKYGPMRASHKDAIVSRLRTLTLLDAARQIKESL
jgi:hypothetical protein